MRFYNKPSSIFLSILFVISLSACTDHYDQLNVDPNAITNEDIQRDNLEIGGFLVLMQKNVIIAGNNSTAEVNQYQISRNLQGDLYSGYMGIPTPFAQGRNNSNYSLIGGWYGAMFSNALTNGMAAWGEINAIETTEDISALSDILKVAIMHQVTDTYGPIPYTNFELNKVNEVYDSQEVVYNQFFNELDSAITVLTKFVSNTPNARPVQQFDLVYDGDYTKWVQFANSLRLRLALRVAEVAPELAKEQAEAAVKHPIGVITSNDASAILRSTTTYPIINPISYICFNYNDVRMGANMESFLKGYQDPRLSVYFNQGTNTSTGESGYYGIRNGIDIQSKNDYTPFSTIKVDNSSPLPWLVAAETYFARAEGALRGWNMNGSAESLYNEGIAMSFEQSGVSGAEDYVEDDERTAAPYVDFVNSVNNVPEGSDLLSTITIKWEQDADFETNLERILTQKWLAMFPHGQEAWSEFRRTGYPKLFPVVVNYSSGSISTDEQIKRMPFPESEYNTNPEGVNNGISKLNGPDNGGTPLWWDVD